MCIHPFLRHNEDAVPDPDRDLVEAPVEPVIAEDDREPSAEEVLVNA